MRRIAPRPLARALDATASELAPDTRLARVQAVWEEVAGPVVAAEGRPVSERAGTVTVRCGSSIWAHELALLEGDLTKRLNEALGDGREEPGVRALRFVAGARGARL